MPKLLLTLCALMTGCACFKEPEVQVRVIDTACKWTKPIYISQQDLLTDETAKQIVAHNEAGLDRCGWAKPKKGTKQ